MKKIILFNLRRATLYMPGLIIIAGPIPDATLLHFCEMLLLRGRIFSAILAANDQMAYGARLALYRRGIRVPEDISLVGFDNQPPSAYMVPPLTSVGWPPLEIGKAAAQGLLARLRGRSYTLPSFPPKLSIRESVSRK